MLPCWTCTCGMWPVSGNVVVANICSVSTTSDSISSNVPLESSLLDNNIRAQLRNNGDRTIFVKAREDNLCSYNTSLASAVLIVAAHAWMDSQCSWQKAPQIDFPSYQQLHILEEAQYDKQLLMPSVQNGLECWRSSCLTSAFLWHSFGMFFSSFGYITASAWLRSTSLARYTHRQPCSMHHLVRLPSGHPFLWWGL